MGGQACQQPMSIGNSSASFLQCVRPVAVAWFGSRQRREWAAVLREALDDTLQIQRRISAGRAQLVEYGQVANASARKIFFLVVERNGAAEVS